MVNKNKKYFIGKVKDFAREKGWFIGHFMDNELLKSELFEIAWQNISNKKASEKDKHYHKISVEINIVLSGQVRIRINGVLKNINQGEFYIIYPYTFVEDVEASDNTELIVVRAPSLKFDKYRE